MRAGRLNLSLLTALALGFAAAGCEQLQPLRQGVVSNYRAELRQLAEDVNNKEMAKAKTKQEQAEEKVEIPIPEVTLAAQWEPAPLISAIHLRAPVPYGVGTARLP